MFGVVFSFRSIRQLPAISKLSAISNTTFTLEEWQSVLKLTSLYEMTRVKDFTIEKMNPLLVGLPSLQIHLAKTYNVREWLAPGLLRLVHRVEPVNEEDVRLLGLSDALKTCALREKVKRCEGCNACQCGIDLKGIGRAFGIRDSDIPGTVSGCMKTQCTCPKKPSPVPLQSRPMYGYA